MAKAPRTTATDGPAMLAAVAAAWCSTGDPPRRTSCFGLPKRVEAPAASTAAWSPRESKSSMVA